MYDIIQLSILLFLTGGIFNPFAILLIVPTIFSSTFLSMGSTIILGNSTIILLLLQDGNAYRSYQSAKKVLESCLKE